MRSSRISESNMKEQTNGNRHAAGVTCSAAYSGYILLPTGGRKQGERQEHVSFSPQNMDTGEVHSFRGKIKKPHEPPMKTLALAIEI